MNKLFQQKFLYALGVIFIFPSLAMAHTGIGDTSGFMHGFSHPVYGVDHLLAMVAVGLWAAQQGGRATWIVPGAFVSVMILGGMLGFSGWPVVFLEAGILTSVLVMGILIVGAFRFPTRVSVLIVGFFALFHGYAHGAEMPASLGAVSYSLGFALSTAIIHSVGIIAGLGLQKLQIEKMARYAGGAIMLSGIYLAIA
ncbi:HupE/UreJ family protein [uncultured Desulfuromusa sp.]|uniref:HupE/UreJ family protein n=1 Tax=uncultured Desulfuromusa sp. TaxID=219183 RepID=UPI002AA93DC1|nr:HupE/UreJ family protein [uncultured Desulfuromusa sp.]